MHEVYEGFVRAILNGDLNAMAIATRVNINFILWHTLTYTNTHSHKHTLTHTISLSLQIWGRVAPI